LDPHSGSDACDAVSWWVWIAWLERDASAGFVFGCAARNFRSAGWANDCHFDIPAVGRMVVCQRTVTDDMFRTFRDALNAGSVEPESLLGQSAPEARVADMRTVLQEGLGHTAAQVALYYTLPSMQNLIGNSDRALELVLSVLEQQLNLPFKSTYAARLGNFEIFDLNPWLDRQQPFLIEVVRNPGQERKGPETWEFCRMPAFADEQHVAHLVGRVNGDVVVDRLVPRVIQIEGTAF
jgi:hypothetical protein